MATKKHISERVKLPEENMVYTFVFPGNRFISYVYVCQRGDGRIMLMNVKTKQFTHMTAGWFSKLRRRQLISTKPYNHDEVIQELHKQEAKAPAKTETYEEQIIREFRELTPAQAFSVEAKIGRSAEALANDLERIKNDKEDSYTQEYINRVFGEMTIARDVVLRLQNKQGNGLFSSIL